MSARGRRFISGDAMPVITIRPADVTIEVAAGSTLLEAISASGHAIGYICDGYGECGSCHVYVHQGRMGLSGMLRAEDARLDSLAVGEFRIPARLPGDAQERRHYRGTAGLGVGSVREVVNLWKK